MRLQQLELIRYGKFTGQTLAFPRAACDFHLVLGANEAGKSTLRRAVAELLFGMPLRSDMAFLHPVAELRLGGVLEADAGTLAFHRSRSRKSLRRPDDEALPDNALAPFLGPTSEALFQRMFCLDLAGLLAGGQSILDAQDDVGQLLFQSASGLAGLGAVRDALAEEAKGLYAPRKAGDRAFYQALERHEQARQTLRHITVKASQWTAAMERVETLQAAQREATAQYQALSATRGQLERVRRIAPRVAQLQDLQERWQALAGAVDFPADAAQRLASAEVAIATQATTLELHQKNSAALQAERVALPPEDRIGAQAAAVDALVAQGHACLQHRQKIARAEHEVQALLRDAAATATQLGWPADEAGQRARLPSALALKTLGALMDERAGLLQGQQSAQAGRDRAQAALARLQQGQQAAPALPPLSPTLAAALQDALALKASPARQRTLLATQAQAAAQLEAALAGLGAWRMDLPALAALALPAEEQLAALKAERAARVATLEAARQQQAQALEQARQSALLLEQFSASHSVVTLEDVATARAQRNAQWQRIKQAQEPLAEGAPRLDRAIEEADRLVDSQRDHAADSAQLLSLRQAQARDAAAAQARQQQLADALQALDAFDTRWAEQARALGLVQMPLLDLSSWRLQRQAALDAAGAHQAAVAALQAEQAAEAAARAALQAALQASGTAPEAGHGLAELIALAEQQRDDRQAARAAAELLARQLADAQREFDHHEQALQACVAEVAQWRARWAAAAAGWQGSGLTPDTARAAIELAGEVNGLLAQVDERRRHRIQALQQELADFEAAAQALQAALGLSSDIGDAHAAASALAQRLQQAREVQQTRQRLSEEGLASESQARSAEAALAATRASLTTLYTLAGSEDHAALRARIEDSDRRRALAADLQQQRQALVEQGDGLTLDALVAEAARVPPETLKPRLDELDAELSAAVEQRTRLATELAQAQAELGRVQGGSDAAVAESMRLEALAQLGDAAERYVTVATGHRLLRWAIDRYRERKQGPLLQRASALFAQLTLGGFSRLVPDFEHTPPKLIALRAGAERVDIEGLSEGTRDQLFLALRLAALELHIASDRPLPFIADDLFVNFHDSRSRAGLAALGELARQTQVIFLTHHEHLVDVARECIGNDIHVIELAGG